MSRHVVCPSHRSPCSRHAVGLRLAGAVGLALALTACQGLGRVPTSLVWLYDQGAVDGVIEIEIGRDGVIRAMEADVPVDMLPAAVRAAATARLPGGDITGAERELMLDGDFWEVKLVHEGRAWELVIDDVGAIRETEKELEPSEAPAHVLVAADAALPGGELKSVEIITRPGAVEYHVKKLRYGASYKAVLGPDGRILRLVREARAEIEIPLGT